MTPGAALSFDPDGLRELFAAGRNDEIAARFLRFLDASVAASFDTLAPETRRLLDAFALNLLYFFAQPGYLLHERDAVRFIDHNQTIANLVALSAIGTTDAALRQILGQAGNVAKILALYSPRNELHLDASQFFDLAPGLASRWWFAFFGNEYGKVASRNALAHLRAHLGRWDARMAGLHAGMHEPYFGATYIAPGAVERSVKHHLNQLIRRDWAAGISIKNRPNPRKAAVISGTWQDTHSSYRSTHRFVDALAQRFELTFVALAGQRYDATGFAQIIEGPTLARRIERIADNDFQLVFYPDIGMTLDSMLLANLRLAPIQISALGHSASSFGAEIDYCVSGIAAEPADRAAENYSERLILVPGIGMTAKPIAPLRLSPPKPDVPVVVNCPWSAPKANHEMLLLLRRVRERARRPAVFQFFPAAGLRNTGYPLFAREVANTVGNDCVRIFPALSQPEYFAAIEGGHITIDAYPFGGINTLVDSLYFGIPFVCWEGARAFNRFAAGLCRAIGLDELIATDEASYVAKVLRLIDDDDERARVAARCRAVDLARSVFAYDPGLAFLRAIDYVVANDAALKASGDRTPLVFA